MKIVLFRKFLYLGFNLLILNIGGQGCSLISTEDQFSQMRERSQIDSISLSQEHAHDAADRSTQNTKELEEIVKQLRAQVAELDLLNAECRVKSSRARGESVKVSSKK